MSKEFLKPHLWLIRFIGVIVPRRFRTRWRREWEAELEYREEMLARWDRLDWRNKLELMRRSLGAFWDALLLQPRRLEDEMFQDLRFGVRMFLKNPGFTAVAILALALGIGANTAIFSLVDAVLWRPLPFREPERLVLVGRTGAQGSANDAPVSAPIFIDWQNRNEVFSRMTAFDRASLTLAGEPEPEVLSGATVSAGFFDTLGVLPALGRGFLTDEDQPGAEPVVLLSHALWQRRFGGDPGIVGKRLTVNDRPVTVVGVMPPGFDYPGGITLWTIFTPDSETDRNYHHYAVVARLKPGVTVKQAQANMDGVSRQMAEQYPQSSRHHFAWLYPLHEYLVGDFRKPLLLLFGAIGLVLLIACANVANLLLMRAAGRGRELAVRAALGASRRRLIRQMLTESALLAALGGAAGLLVAVWCMKLISGFSSLEISRMNEVTLDWRVLGFTGLAVLLTSLFCGVVPAWLYSRQPPGEALKDSVTRATGGRRSGRLRGGLVVAELALSLTLLIGAGLLIKSFVSLQAVKPGFNPEGVMTLNVVLPLTRFVQPAQQSAFVAQVAEKLQALPGVQSTALGASVPMDGNYGARVYAIEGRPVPDPGNASAVINFPVSPDYFRALQIPLLKGRGFSERDDAKTTPVIIVNQSFARRYFPDEDATGRRVRLVTERPSVWREIVGVVGDVKQERLNARVRPIVYFPYSQRPGPIVTLLARSSGDQASLANAMKQIVYSVDKDLGITRLATLEQLLGNSLAQSRSVMTLLAAFAALALALAAIGIYSVLAYSVTQRAQEIGIRLALGAQRSDVVRLIVGQGLKLIGLGVALGLSAAFGLTHLMRDLLFGISATDPIIFTAVPLLLAAVALLACYVPARRATRVDPLAALRYE
jgi:putative ABC transport system permease protein